MILCGWVRAELYRNWPISMRVRGKVGGKVRRWDKL
jgi:hypothetical protein